MHHGFLFLSITFLYFFLVQLGGTFYSFQWDTLLLETGWLVSICYAPWTRLRSTTAKDSQDVLSKSNEIGSWPIRFLLFKLMFMSGVVKIQANCQTWNQLTALEYHFATQCLPGPLAWYAHQLHPLFLRLSVAMTFLIEIQGAILLIMWRSDLRRIGAWLQIMLQVMIILSGNYNFFNALTILLCLPCIESNSRHEGDDKRKESSFLRKDIGKSLGVAYFAWSFATMFEIQNIQDGEEQLFTITLSWTKSDCEAVIGRCVPTAIALVFVQLSYNLYICKNKKGSTFCHFVVCAACIGMSTVPLLTLSPGLSSGTWTMLPTRCFVEPWRIIQPFHFSNGYGLFRKMTGVGTHGLHDDRVGWGGLPPSIVERPEIILAGQLSSTGEFRELKFRWKPGDVAMQPRQVAPYQPRLDWQMWFAALGSYQNNPWFVHLISKILNGCAPVIDLLDEPMLANGEEKLISMRSILFIYDFSRISENGSVSKNWWIRTQRQDFMPSLEASNPSLAKFLSSRGFIEGMCTTVQDRCETLSTNDSRFQYLCPLVGKFFRI